MDEKMDTVPAGTEPGTGGKTFTQEQVNAIVGERLAKEKAKADATLAEREQELARRELQMTAKEKLADAGLPVGLLDALNISDAESLDKSMSIVMQHMKINKTEPIEIEGAKPAAPGAPRGTTGDAMIREAMGLK